MNKKIYYNNKFILLGNEDRQTSQDQSIKSYSNLSEQNLKEVMDEFLSEKKKNSIKIVTEDPTFIFNQLKQLFYSIEAAGGFIEKNQQYLFIHRHGRWDLPKGKLEKNETIENAALRECEEECGVKNLQIVHALASTFHFYAYKNSFAFKQTYWFYMKTNYVEKLTPQIEESIDEARWFNKEDIISHAMLNTYFTINDILAEALALR